MNIGDFFDSFDYFIQLIALWDFMPLISLNDFEYGLLDNKMEDNDSVPFNSYVSNNICCCTGGIINSFDYGKQENNETGDVSRYVFFTDEKFWLYGIFSDTQKYFGSSSNLIDERLYNLAERWITADNTEFPYTVNRADGNTISYSDFEEADNLSRFYSSGIFGGRDNRYKALYENINNSMPYTFDSFTLKRDTYTRGDSIGLENELLYSYCSSFNMPAYISSAEYPMAERTADLWIKNENAVSVSTMANYPWQLTYYEALGENNVSFFSEYADNYGVMGITASNENVTAETVEGCITNDSSSHILSDYRKNELIKALSASPSGGTGEGISINVDFKAYADIKNDYDIEKFADVFVKRLEAELSSCAEGIHL